MAAKIEMKFNRGIISELYKVIILFDIPHQVLSFKGHQAKAKTAKKWTTEDTSCL